MSIVEHSAESGAYGKHRLPVKQRTLHRLAAVRRLRHISPSTFAQRINVEVKDIRRQERTADLPLSVFYAWQKVLAVPIAELFVETGRRARATGHAACPLGSLDENGSLALESGRAETRAADSPDPC